MFNIEMADNMVIDYLKSMMLEPVEISAHKYYADGTLKVSTCGFSVYTTVEEGCISILYKCPVRVNDKYADNVIKLLSIINGKIKSGCLYYAAEEQTIFYRNDLSCEDETPGMADIECLFQYPLCILHKFDGCIGDCLNGCVFSEEEIIRVSNKRMTFQDAIFTERLTNI